MKPLIEKLEKEINTKVKEIEVWHNIENAKKMNDYSRGLYEGVPLFVNTDTNVIICGETSYEELKIWAKR
jgi:hypothetical protein